MDTITSLQNDRVKLAYSLQNRPRARLKERKIALEGTRLVRDAVERGHKPVFILYEPTFADYDLIATLQDRSVQMLPVNSEVMQHVSDTKQPQGVVGVFPMPHPQLPREPERVLILDNIRDPGNLGTMLRTAAAAGIQVAILLEPGSADPYNPKVLRSGMGAHFRLPIVGASRGEIEQYCANLAVYVTAAEADMSYDAVDWTRPWAIVVSNEAHGASKAMHQIASQSLSIPMAAQTESLNAAVAAGVVLFEAARQCRQMSGG